MSISSVRQRAESIHNPVGELAAEHPGVVKVGRAGWFAKGVVYVIAGFLALSVAAKASGWADVTSSTGSQEASPVGAIKTVAGSAGGSALLWLLAIGMLLYSAWRVVSALLPGSTDAKGWARRIGYIVSAVMYVTFAVSAIALARHTETPDGNKKVTNISASFMSHTFGRVVIGAVGLIVIAVGLYRISKGLKVDVNDELDMSGIAPARAKWTQRVGAIGEVGRGIGFSLVGFFLLRSAITYDANEATGLDGALRRLAVQSWGVVVVVLVGIGFAAYGVFCLATFTHRRLEAP
ncbi:MAG: DUF1206 domain-containing protein [Ilumatobacteraceae bacterium]